MSTVTASSKKKIAKNFNAVSQKLKRTEQCKFCMQIASLKLNFYHQAADSVGFHVITWNKRRFRSKQSFLGLLFLHHGSQEYLQTNKNLNG